MINSSISSFLKHIFKPFSSHPAKNLESRMAGNQPPPFKLLFVCVENSNRSQMSQAFATILGGNKVEAYSAGSKPSGVVNPKVN